jgi:hypothetical protein
VGGECVVQRAQEEQATAAFGGAQLVQRARAAVALGQGADILGRKPVPGQLVGHGGVVGGVAGVSGHRRLPRRRTGRQSGRCGV